MNLTEFNSYRTHCPICDTQLSTGFVSDRRQIVRYEEDRMTVQFPLDSLKEGQKDYRTAYTFGMNDDSFCAEFFTKEYVHLENATPLFLIERFQELHKNLKVYKFFRGCSLCRQYAYGSQQFDIDFKTSRFGPLRVWSEKALLSSPITDGYRAYSLTNLLVENRSELSFWKMDADEDRKFYGYWEVVPAKATTLRLPLVPLLTHKETVTRLNNLIIFS